MKVLTVLVALMSAAAASPGPAAGLKARQDESTDSSAPALERVSALQALETALPQSLINLAVTNSPAASSAIASEFESGPPSWFGNLPSRYQSYFIPPVTVNEAPDAIVSAFPTRSTVVQDAPYAPMTTSMVRKPSMTPSMPYGTNGTRSGVAGGGTLATGYSRSLTRSAMKTPSPSFRYSTRESTTAKSTESASNTAQTQPATTTASGPGASGPTAAVGMGLAGVLGVAGILAL